MSTTALSIIVAMTPEHVIGVRGDLPWTIPSDLARFKRITAEAGTVIMGRKTHESILKRLGTPLSGRRSVVLTHRPSTEELPGVTFVDSDKTALAVAGDRACVIGGEQVFKIFLGRVDVLQFTLVEDGGRLRGDSYFPGLSWNEWEQVEKLPRGRPDPRDEYDTTYETWRRKK